MSGKPELLYFDIRGRAEPIRLLLEFIGVDYIDKQITPERWQSPETLCHFSALTAFHEHFASQPRIQQYLSSSRRPAALFYGPNGKVYPKKER